MTVIEANEMLTVVQDMQRRVGISVYDDDGNLVDATQVDLTIKSLAGTTILSDS